MKNPMRLFDLFSEISFEFYLVHSMILSQIFIYFAGGSLVGVHIKIMFSSFVLSIIWGFLLKKVFSFHLPGGGTRDSSGVKGWPVSK